MGTKSSPGTLSSWSATTRNTVFSQYGAFERGQKTSQGHNQHIVLHFYGIPCFPDEINSAVGKFKGGWLDTVNTIEERLIPMGKKFAVRAVEDIFTFRTTKNMFSKAFRRSIETVPEEKALHNQTTLP